MMAKWKKDLGEFSLEKSSFANLLDKRFAVAASLINGKVGVDKQIREKFKPDFENFKVDWDELAMLRDSKSWPDSFSKLAVELSNRFPTYALRSLPRSETDLFMNQLESFILGASYSSEHAASALALMITFSILYGSPAYIFSTINCLLLVEQKASSDSNFSIVLPVEIVAPSLNILQYHESFLRVSAPFVSAELSTSMAM